MKIQDLKNLDYYTCSLQDINKAHKALTIYIQSLIKKGHSTASNFKGTDVYNEAKNMHILISRARQGMTPDGYMMTSNNDLNRLPNAQSIL